MIQTIRATNNSSLQIRESTYTVASCERCVWGRFSRSFVCKLFSNDLQSNCIRIYDPIWEYKRFNWFPTAFKFYGKITNCFKTFIFIGAFNFIPMYMKKNYPFYMRKWQLLLHVNCEICFSALCFGCWAGDFSSSSPLLLLLLTHCSSKWPNYASGNCTHKSQRRTQSSQHFYALNQRHNFFFFFWTNSQTLLFEAKQFRTWFNGRIRLV